MCKHDFESQTIICPDCEGEGQRHLHAMGPEQCITCHGRGNISGKPIHKLITNLETALIDNLYKQLAAANARIASLEKQNSDLFPYYQDHLEGALIPATEYQQWIKRAEKAEARCAAWIKADEIRDKIQELRTAAQFEGYGAELEAEELLPKLWEEYNKLTTSNAGAAILAQNKRMREALEAIEKIPSCQTEDCCYGGKAWALAFGVLKEIEPNFKPSDLPDINEIDEPESSHIHAREKRMREALERIAACLNQSEHNAMIALQIAEQWEQMGEKHEEK